MNLNDITRMYLNTNGIKHKTFTDYVGVDYTIGTKWLNNQQNKKLNPEQLGRVHMFLQGDFIKTVDEILRGEI